MQPLITLFALTEIETDQDKQKKWKEKENVDHGSKIKHGAPTKLKKKVTFESVFNPHVKTLDRTQNMSTEQKAWYFEKLLRNLLDREENPDRKMWPRKSSDILTVLTKRKVNINHVVVVLDMNFLLERIICFLDFTNNSSA